MGENEYELRYLPLFLDDLTSITRYIAETLCNPDAAIRLTQNIEAAILKRRPFAESFAPYPTMKKRKQPYYAIYVGKYVIYYVVIDHSIMEVRRLLYMGQNRVRILDEDK